jgi:hypothetical protein
VTLRDLPPPLLIAFALGAWATGALDSLGFEGAGQGLGIGAAVCAPIWLLGLHRRFRRGDRDDRTD